MLLTPYRVQVQTALAEAPAQRKPFLRRSLRADALLTTDLPCVAASGLDGLSDLLDAHALAHLLEFMQL